MGITLEQQFSDIATDIALVIEAGAVFVVSFGALQAIISVVGAIFSRAADELAGREIWLKFATWILLALEFALAADLVRTAVAPTWEDIAWVRELWGGPFMLKGVMRVDDAKRAVDAGVSAISVSNHGGNNLDGTPAAIRALPAIAAAVGHEVEVLLDGGIRRGSDVVKSLALGARAVMIGRAYLWGLAAAGQAGVENVLDILRGGIDSALMGLGRASVHDLVAEDILVPAGFTRALGVPPSQDA